MRTTGILAGVALATLITTVATSRSDTGDESGSASANVGSEPITSSPSTPVPGSEVPSHDPFLPFATGQESLPGSLWSYSSLTPVERSILNHGLAEDYTAINNAYAGAAKARAGQAQAEAAAIQLGIDHLDTTGTP